jgi:hypothetical protein
MSAIFDKNMKKLKFWSLAYLLLVGKGIIINSIFFASQWFFLNVWAHFKIFDGAKMNTIGTQELDGMTITLKGRLTN